MCVLAKGEERTIGLFYRHQTEMLATMLDVLSEMHLMRPFAVAVVVVVWQINVLMMTIWFGYWGLLLLSI